MVCGPGQVSGPSAIPFWSTCYDINSDMGAFLTSRSPNFQAELSDPNYVWRQFGKPPKDEAGRQRLATAGPSLREQLQASLNALHPVLGKDEVAQALFDQGQKMLSTLRGLTPDTKALEASMKQKIGDAAARYGPGALQQFYDEETKQKLLGIIGAATAPLAVKYGGLAKALSGTITAGAIGGATVLIAGIWNGWVQERLGEQMNELHATSGQLAEHVAGPPYEDYYPGDWVAMRELRDRAWQPRLGLVLHGSKDNSRYWRFRVGVLPSGDIVWRDAADLALVDQQKMAAAVRVDPKLDVWRAAMAVKDDALYNAPAGRGRRLVQTDDPTDDPEYDTPSSDDDIPATPRVMMGNVVQIEEEEAETERMRAELLEATIEDLMESGVGSKDYVRQETAEEVRDDYEVYQKYLARPRVTEQQLNQWSSTAPGSSSRASTRMANCTSGKWACGNSCRLPR